MKPKKVNQFTCILVLFTFLCLHSLSAQSYIPFQFGKTRWMYNQQNMFNTKSYCYFSMDTTGYYYNGNKYWPIEKLNQPVYSTPVVSTKYIHDDTLNRKVYTIDTSTNLTYLLYDFSANMGDTLYVLGTDTVVVDSVKIITINSIARKHLYVRKIGNLITKTWIEGLGSTYELFYPAITLPDPVFTMICQEYDNVENYGNATSCANFLTGVYAIPDPVALELFPNPCVDILTIQGNLKSDAYRVIVFDLLGNKLIEVENERSINISILSKGLYYLSITSLTDTRVQVIPFVKE